VAAHLEPEILVVDEVLAVGDAEFQKKCLGKMKDVATGGRTVMFVSHNMAAIRQLTENCLVLSQGKKAFHGKTEESIADYSKLCLAQPTPLSKRTSRYPSKITKIQLTKPDGGPLNPYTPGEPIRLQVEIEKDSSPALSVDFFCKSHLGESLAFGSFHFFHGKRLPAKAGRYLCRIDLEGLNLASGEYGVEARLTVPFERYEDTMELPAAIQVAFCNPAGGAGDLKAGMNLAYLAWVSKKEVLIDSK
jgi:lipopolysaccharide transport system ATP-binding protein